VAGTFGGDIDTLHTLKTKTPDDRDLVFFTGTIVITGAFPGSGEGTATPDLDGWSRGTIEVEVGPRWEQLENVAPAAAPASFFGFLYQPSGPERGFGWATDRCTWSTDDDGRFFLKIDVAVRGSDLSRDTLLPQ
jgi:hypothetical protein